MPYGIIKVDQVTFTNAGVDQTISVSGVVASISGNITATGTISGNVIRGGTTVSGATVTGTAGQFGTITGTAGQFGTITGNTAGFTTVTGTTVTGTTATFTSGVFTNISGGTHTVTSGVFASGTAANPSITFQGDVNTGIYSPGADQVAVATNGTGRLFVDASGNVGIGATPNSYAGYSTLTINNTTGGELDFEVNGTLTSDIYTDSAGTYWTTRTAVPIVLRTNSVERLRITSAGLVGIGTSAPGEPLNVLGGGSTTSTVNFTGGATGNDNATIASDYSLNFQIDANNDIGGRAYAWRYGGKGYSDGTHLMTLDASGRLGLGTSSPTLQFEISNGTNTGYLHPGIGTGLSVGTKNSSSLSLDTNNTTRVTVTSAGLVGIGSTPDDSFRVTINGNSAGVAPGILFTDSAASPRNFAFYINGSKNLVIRDSTASSDRLTIDSSGRLLVGTSSVISNNYGGTAGRLQVANNDYLPIGFFTYNNTAGETGFCPYLELNRARGTQATPTTVANGDDLGLINFYGHDGSTFIRAAPIKSVADDIPGTNDMPGRLVFGTTSDGASSPTARIIINSGGTLYPATDNAYQAGGGGFRWTAIYAVNGTIQTSDARQKTNVSSCSLGSAFIKSLQPVSFKWIEGGNTVTKSEDGETDVITAVPGERTHWGFLAQDVKAAVDDAGVDFGGWILTDKNDPDSAQGLRYDQFIAPLTKALQEALTEIDVLKVKVAALEAS